MDIEDPHVRRFLEYAQAKGREHRVRLIIAEQYYFFANGKKVYGFFEHPQSKRHVGKIAVARKGKVRPWLHVLAHEFGHFGQWVEQCPVWVNDEFEDEYVTALIEGGQAVPEDTMVRHYLAKRELELDCEFRALKIIRDWELPIDIHDYASYANLHVLMYTHRIEEFITSVEDERTRMSLEPYLLGLYPEEFVEDDREVNFFREFFKGNT